MFVMAEHPYINKEGDCVLLQKILEHVRGNARQRSIARVHFGISYVGVELDDGAAGLAHILRHEFGARRTVITEAGTLRGRSAWELAQWALDPCDLLKSALGVAVINALADYKQSGHVATIGNALELLDLQVTDQVGMVGAFFPLITRVRQRAGKLLIFERQNCLNTEETFPDWAEPILLPACDVVIITGSAFVNKTIEQVLGYCQNAREVLVMGPTTPLYPHVLQDSGITLLGGAEIAAAQKENIFCVLAEGGGETELNNYLQKITFRIR